MLRKRRQRDARWILAASCALLLLCSGVVLAADTWVDEVWNMVIFEKASYPGSNFDPYLQKLDRIRVGLDREDQHIVKMETDRFLKMLLDRRHGINDVAADEIYNFVLSVRPSETGEAPAASSTIELGPNTERPISVPEHTVNTPYEGGKFCGADGCDYWLDDVYDPGAAG
jgi:hypothetical protein